MRVLFRLWVVWAVLWFVVIETGDGFDAANAKAVALLVLGPFAVVCLILWIVRGAQRKAP